MILYKKVNLFLLSITFYIIMGRQRELWEISLKILCPCFPPFLTHCVLSEENENKKIHSSLVGIVPTNPRVYVL